jgi:hypothetical protein
LDVQTVLGLAAGIPTSFLSVGNVINNSADFSVALFDTTTFLSTTQSPPSVFTTSFGDDETQFSPQDLQYVVVAAWTLFLFLMCAITGRSAMDTWPLVLAASP